MNPFQVKLKTVDMEEVKKLETFIGGKIYSVVSHEARGLQFAVVVPYGTPRGLRTFWKMVWQFMSTVWRHVA